MENNSLFKFKAATELTGQSLGIQKKVGFETSELRELALAVERGGMTQADIAKAVNYFASNIDKHVGKMVAGSRQTSLEWRS